MDHPGAPPLPPGRRLDLPGRGRTFVREIPGPPGAPTLVLLHGLGATADLNWFRCYGPLGRRYRVVAVDHRGHGRGIRSRRPFRLSDCADDVAAVADELGIERLVAVGYSMGGPVAQLLWRRHRHLVDGLVLCATSRSFTRRRPADRMLLGGLIGLSAAAQLTPFIVRRQAAAMLLGRSLGDSPIGRWAASELRRTDHPAVIQAAHAVASFDSRPWIADVDVPAAVVVTAHDQLVHPSRQLKLARDIPGATVHRVLGDHGACVTAPQRFVPALLEACASVSRRLPSSASPRSATS